MDWRALFSRMRRESVQTKECWENKKMTNEYREQDGPAGMELYVELGNLVLAGKVSHAALAAFNRQFRDPPRQPTDETYSGILAAAIARCGCKYNDGELTADVFGPDIFGTLGEGYVLGEPTKSEAAKKRGHWLKEDFDSWLAGPEVAGKGLEAAYLVDVCEYGHDNPNTQLTTPVLCWRPTKTGRVAYLSGRDGERHFCVYGQARGWVFQCRVLLRKVR